MKNKDLIIAFVTNLFMLLFIGVILFWTVVTKTEIPILVGLCVGIVVGQQLFGTIAWFKAFLFYFRTKDPLVQLTIKSHLEDSTPQNHTLTTLSGCQGILKSIQHHFPNSVLPVLIEDMELQITKVKYNSPE